MHTRSKTVVDPMKKLNAEFSSIAAALKRRDEALNECLKLGPTFVKSYSKKDAAHSLMEELDVQGPARP